MVHIAEYRIGNIICWNPALKDPSITLPALNVEITAILPDKIGYISPNIEHRVEFFEDGPVQKGIAYRGLDEVEPVLLTPEIIKEVGFVASRLDIRDEQGYHSFTHATDVVTYASDGSEFQFKCKYLHQLQNIYYLLKGIELDVSGVSIMP